jgi:hypothetical protein
MATLSPGLRLRAPGHPAGGAGSGLLLLAVWCGFLFFYGLNAGELYRTEGLRAIVAAEILRSGNWLVPMLYGEPLLTKPPGMYAAIALVSWPFGGVHDWSARLPSALAATATVFLVYWYFGRQLGCRGGLVSAAILPASLPWLDRVPTAEIDMLQVAWVTAAILFFLRAVEEDEKAEGRRQKAGQNRLLLPSAFCLLPSGFWWFAALLCVAGGVLTKWTAPAFFYGTAVPLLWWRGRLRLLFGWPHLVSAAVAAGLCLAWAGAAVAWAGWDTFAGTVGREALQRLSPGHHPRPYPWGEALLHPLLILATNLPWSGFALLTLRPGFARRWDERGRRLLQALHCWTWPNLLFWSVVAEHSPRHSFPLFPGLIGLAALVWVAWLQQDTREAGGMQEGGEGRGAASVPRFPLLPLSFCLLPWRPGRVLVGLLAVWLVVKLAFVHAVIPARNHHRQPRAKGEQLAALVPPGETLYLGRLKDEGILFYYGRPVVRLPDPGQLASPAGLLYCILDQFEWQHWPPARPVAVLLRLRDQQGAPIVLVRAGGNGMTTDH